MYRNTTSRAPAAGEMAPALGGMSLIENRLTTALRETTARSSFRTAGDKVLGRSGEPQVVNPRGFPVQPGGRVGRPLSPSLVQIKEPAASTLNSSR